MTNNIKMTRKSRSMKIEPKSDCYYHYMISNKMAYNFVYNFKIKKDYDRDMRG